MLLVRLNAIGENISSVSFDDVELILSNILFSTVADGSKAGFSANASKRPSTSNTGIGTGFSKSRPNTTKTTMTQSTSFGSMPKKPRKVEFRKQAPDSEGVANFDYLPLVQPYSLSLVREGFEIDGPALSMPRPQDVRVRR